LYNPGRSWLINSLNKIANCFPGDNLITIFS
jgi:hypothetical protein